MDGHRFTGHACTCMSPNEQIGAGGIRLTAEQFHAHVDSLMNAEAS